MLSILREVARQLGYYVYLYIDLQSERPFYIGKGQGERVLSHLSAHGESRKVRVLDELRAAGLEPRLDILAHGLNDEETALRIEAAVIDLLGLDELTDEVRGWRSIQLGRMALSRLVSCYAPVQSSVIVDPTLLIRINRLYRHGISDRELYDATRGVRKLGPRRNGAKLAFAIFEGVVREVFKIQNGHPAGTTAYQTRTDIRSLDRWEFEGKVAQDEIRNKYINKSVEQYFARNSQNPVKYVNC